MHIQGTQFGGQSLATDIVYIGQHHMRTLRCKAACTSLTYALGTAGDEYDPPSVPEADGERIWKCFSAHALVNPA